MGKSFDQYKAEHLKEPFPLPMPDGSSIPLKLGTIAEEKAVLDAVAKARAAGTLTPFTGIEVLVGDVQAAEIAEAWGKLPQTAWDDVMTDRREHFGQGN